MAGMKAHGSYALGTSPAQSQLVYSPKQNRSDRNDTLRHAQTFRRINCRAQGSCAGFGAHASGQAILSRSRTACQPQRYRSHTSKAQETCSVSSSTFKHQSSLHHTAASATHHTATSAPCKVASGVESSCTPKDKVIEQDLLGPQLPAMLLSVGAAIAYASAFPGERLSS